MTKKITFLLLSLLLSFSAFSIEKTVTVTTPGTLKSLLGNNINSITKLTIKGTLNQTDFSVFIEGMANLLLLDMKDARVPNNRLSGSTFYGCLSEGKLILPESVVAIEGGAFDSANFSEIQLPKGLKELHDAFPHYKKGVTIDFSRCAASLEYFGALVEVWIPINKGVVDLSECTKIKNWGLFHTSDRMTIILPKNMEFIPNAIFSQIYMGTIILPQTVKNIAAEAFSFMEGGTIVLKTSTPPILGKGAYKNCSFIVPKGSLAAYKAAPVWKDLLNLEDEASAKIELNYTEDRGAKILEKYEGVRIGEYYWMDRPFSYKVGLNKEIGSQNDYALLDASREFSGHQSRMDSIKIWHKRAKMFEWGEREPSNYFDQIAGLGVFKMVNINKYYGAHHARAYITFMYHYGQRLGEGAYVRMLEGYERKYDTSKLWDLPDATAVQQLIGMCGNGMMDEIRTQLSPCYNEKGGNLPCVIKDQPYMGWFDRTIHVKNGLADANQNFLESNGKVKYEYANRYGFNMFPSGAVHNDGPEIFELTGEKIAYAGTFHGFNQEFTMYLHGNAFFRLHDFAEIQYVEPKDKPEHWVPIRWCRPLTAEELGYKLYINVSDFKDNENNYKYAVDMYNNHKSKAKVIKIVKREGASMNTVPAGFSELPKGLLRGFYVQYMINDLNSGKTIEDILMYTQRSPRLFPQDISKSRQAFSAESLEEPLIEENILIYPNPVVDVLNIEGYSSVKDLQLYNSAGNLVIKRSSVGNALDLSGLPQGMYILKLQTVSGTQTHKIMKK